MAWQITSHIRNIRGITPSERNVLYELSNYDQGNGAWPSTKTLAENVSISERGIRQILQHLESKGIIKRERRQDEAGASIPTVYLIIGFNYDTIAPKKPACNIYGTEAAQPCTPPPPPCTAMPDPCTAVPPPLHSHADPPAQPCPPNKEGTVIRTVIRTVREQPPALALEKTSPRSTPSPTPTPARTVQIPEVFSWNSYAQGHYGTRRPGWGGYQPRMTPQVERSLNSIVATAKRYGQRAALKEAKDHLPPSWQAYLRLDEVSA